jgi:hypothetical protein
VPDIVFEGGPRHGDRRTMTRLPILVHVPYVKPLPLLISAPPRPPWWHPLRRRRWSPPPIPEPPVMQQLAYRDTGQDSDGARVYRLDGWPWFKGPEVAKGEDGGLYKSAVAAAYAIDPRIRRDGQTRWVMDLTWYKLMRRMSGDDSDPEKWVPSPDDTFLGIRVMVTEDGGAAHLENRRYPADYP